VWRRGGLIDLCCDSMLAARWGRGNVVDEGWGVVGVVMGMTKEEG
jgi:hypothetical protein